ncbi:MAG TPA: M14-type cytosolic carboxypeptidase [Stellaceae bacterium]|nr:M14-type cytosolic carboxypeptidase [Stellaceae bacterium]
MRISSQFDGGNIHCLACDDPQNIRLAINKDAHSDFYQWFYFRLTGAKGCDCVLHLTNAGGAAYAEGWHGYRAVASYDRADWFRVPTSYDGTALTIRHRPECDAVYYAYFAPYSMERHADLVARCLANPAVRLDVLGSTLDGQDLDLLRIGEPGAGKRVCWIVGRQHPGETMAEWWMEGFLARLLDADDPLAREALKRAAFNIVPNMNPDGSRRGHLRTNAAGANLNREWQSPSLERSPEVFLVRQAMEASGVDFCLDVHGDETVPHNFLISTAGTPSASERLRLLHQGYAAALRRANPDFQTIHGHAEGKPGSANMTLCGNWVAERFDCLSMTLEMPFKDTADTPNERTGWSPARSRKLGAAGLDALLAVIDELR